MGRAGGGHSGGHSSGGSHSFSHSSGGHHVSSTHSRAGANSSRSSSSSSFSSGRLSSGIGGYNRFYGRSYGRSYSSYIGRGSYDRSGSSTNDPEVARIQSRTTLITVAIIALLILGITIIPIILTMSSGPKITHTREKIESGNVYMNDCVRDEIYWINNPSRLSTQLQDFWKKTGVQPFIYLKSYDPSLTTDAQKEDYTVQYYEENFPDRENVFLFIYFAEADTDNDVGYMTYANGYQTGTVMDSEALDVFWSYMDSDWYSWDADDTDGMFVDVFNKTAKTIMGKPKSIWSTLSTLIIVIGVIVALIIVLAIIKHKMKASAARAEETERILSTPMQELVGESSAEATAKKYE